MYINKDGKSFNNTVSLILLVILIFVQAVGFILMKHVSENSTSFIEITTHAFFYCIFAMAILRALAWPFVIHYIELSFANSLSSLSPILLLLSSYFIFNEVLEIKHFVGGAFIVLGNIMICRGKKT